MQTQWVVPVVCLHMLYVAVLFGVAHAVRHIEFRFHEFKDILRGILVSTIAIGLWVVAYVLNEVHEDILWVQVTSRFLLLVMMSILVLAFFSMSVSQPLLSQMSLRRRDSLEYMSMGKALGIPDSGLIQRAIPTVLDINEPLDKLLLNKRFRQSMDFAERELWGWQEGNFLQRNSRSEINGERHESKGTSEDHMLMVGIICGLGTPTCAICGHP